jgi:integrase
MACKFYTWLLGRKSNGMYYADGRGNSPPLGRHSLETRDAAEARKALDQLDLVKAVEHGKADAAALKQHRTESLPLERGWELYRQHVQRPRVMGGASPSTVVRYRAVFRKFIAFAQAHGVGTWNQVTTPLVEGYACFLESDGKASRTLDLEVTTLKQATKWFVERGYLPADHQIKIKVKRVVGTNAYCWSTAEFQAMVDYCYSRPSLHWLWAILIGLGTTGLRISELASIRWTDVDQENNIILLTDEGGIAPRRRRGTSSPRTTKNHRSRSFPIHKALKRVLSVLQPSADGRVFHSSRGKRVWPDSVRKALTKQVLNQLSEKFPDSGFTSGTPHSFRHYFCSTCANKGVPERMVMEWLGHQSSEMISHYYHLGNPEAQRQMQRVRFVEVRTSPLSTGSSPESKAS